MTKNTESAKRRGQKKGQGQAARARDARLRRGVQAWFAGHADRVARRRAHNTDVTKRRMDAELNRQRAQAEELRTAASAHGLQMRHTRAEQQRDDADEYLLRFDDEFQDRVTKGVDRAARTNRAVAVALLTEDDPVAWRQLSGVEQLRAADSLIAKVRRARERQSLPHPK